MTQLTELIVSAFPNGVHGKAGELVDEARRLDAENAVLRARLEAAEELLVSLFGWVDQLKLYTIPEDIKQARAKWESLK